MPVNPVQYAEETLGVHFVYEEALAAHKDLDAIITDLDAAKDQRRSTETAIYEQEIQLFAEQKSKHADKSATAFEQLYKQAKGVDPELKKLRGALDQIVGQISGLEYDAKMVEFTIKMKCARMEELGGYLNYLASAKNAQIANKVTTPIGANQA